MPPRRDVAVIGPWGAEGAHALRDFLTRIDQPYEWLEPDAAGALVARHALPERWPLVVIEGRQALAAPSLAELADTLGIRYPPAASAYDLIVIGAGPAGLAAAVYAASDGLRIVVAERGAPGGQAAHTARIENYFGLDPLAPPMTGAHLARIGGRQAEQFGAELLILRGAVGGDVDPDGTHRVRLATGEELTAPAVLCAVGVEWRRLEVPGVDELLGRGVSYGAGRSEAPRHRGEHVAIVGGGNSAGQAALDLAGHGARVTMICRGSDLSATLSRYLADRIAAEPLVEVRLRTQVVELHGDGTLRGVTVEDAAGARQRVDVAGLFLAIGGVPQTGWTDGTPIRCDAAGYILTGPDLLDRGVAPEDWPLERPPLALEASVPGFFVAGDVRAGSTKRVAAAVGEGANVAALVHRYLDQRRAEA